MSHPSLIFSHDKSQTPIISGDIGLGDREILAFVYKNESDGTFVTAIDLNPRETHTSTHIYIIYLEERLLEIEIMNPGLITYTFLEDGNVYRFANRAGSLEMSNPEQFNDERLGIRIENIGQGEELHLHTPWLQGQYITVPKFLHVDTSSQENYTHSLSSYQEN